MVLVSVNMPRFGFSLYKKKKMFLVPAKTKYFAGTKTYKMGPVIMCHVCKSSQKWGQGLF